jgi:hypothetical protein
LPQIDEIIVSGPEILSGPCKRKFLPGYILAIITFHIGYLRRRLYQKPITKAWLPGRTSLELKIAIPEFWNVNIEFSEKFSFSSFLFFKMFSRLLFFS